MQFFLFHLDVRLLWQLPIVCVRLPQRPDITVWRWPSGSSRHSAIARVWINSNIALAEALPDQPSDNMWKQYGGGGFGHPASPASAPSLPRVSARHPGCPSSSFYNRNISSTVDWLCHGCYTYRVVQKYRIINESYETANTVRFLSQISVR